MSLELIKAMQLLLTLCYKSTWCTPCLTAVSDSFTEYLFLMLDRVFSEGSNGARLNSRCPSMILLLLLQSLLCTIFQSVAEQNGKFHILENINLYYR